ncbi:MAG: Gfo/Idh/MocA family protein [Thermoguttaceae bacterium]
MMNLTSRRQFLEDSMFASVAAGAAASGVVPVFAQDAAAVSANAQYGVAVIGCGGRGGDTVSGFLGDPRTVIRYLCDPDRGAAEQKAKTVAEKQKGVVPKVVTDLREALDDKEVHLVGVATPNHWHALAGIWAMQAGKHCYIEKPVCHNIHEGRALTAASKKYNLVVQTGTQCRSQRANIDAVAFIRSGEIGEVKFSRGLCYKRRAAIGPRGDYPIPTSVDYSLWSGPATIEKLTRPKLHYDWHWQRLYGNGDFGNQGPHQTDIARWHLGLDRHPRQILTYGGRLGYQAEKKDDNYIDAGDVANTEVTLCDYGDMCIVFETRGLETPDLRGAKVGVITYGSTGYVVQSEYSYSAAFDLDGNRIKEFKGGGNHYANFIDAVVAGDPSKAHATALCGHYSAGISHLGNISYYLGESNRVSANELRGVLEKFPSLDNDGETLDRTIAHLEANGVDMKKYPMSLGVKLTFDGDKEKFVDNAAADAMLTRNYREPFVVPVIV